MSSDDKQNDWSQDPSLSGIDFARLQALQQMASQSRGKSQAEMMPCKHTFDGQFFAIVEASIHKRCQHRIKGESEEERAARFQEIFYDIKNAGEKTSCHWSEQVIDKAVRDSGKSNADIRSDINRCYLVQNHRQRCEHGTGCEGCDCFQLFC